MYYLTLFVPVLLAFLLGCSGDPESTQTNPAEQGVDLSHKSLNSKDAAETDDLEPASTQQQPVADQGDKIVASMGDINITLNEVDHGIALALFDLEWRKYLLRKERAYQLLEHYQTDNNRQADSAVFIEPPVPPRISLPHDGRQLEGKPDAPVMLSVFCSYQSSHCARLWQIKRQLSQHYQDSLAFMLYDFPQNFHRYGKFAANASNCASLQQQGAAFDDALYADQSKQDKTRVLIIAEQLGLELSSFEACLDETRFAANIEADLAFGRSLGLGNVPVVFVNGLYVRGPQTFEAYQYYIDQELAMVGAAFAGDPSTQKVLRSTLPMRLIATTVSNERHASLAQIALSPDSKGSMHAEGEMYREGATLSGAITLIKIEQQRIVIDNDGRLEYVPLQASVGYDLAQAAQSLQLPSKRTSAVNENQDADLVRRPDGEPDRESFKFRELPLTGETTLNYDWLQNQLADPTKLEAYIENAEHVVEGHHLVKLKGVADQRFYTTLGLHDGDVLMRVNDQWVHDGQNPLWESLADSGSTTLIVMRKGFPVRLDYRVN